MPSNFMTQKLHLGLFLGFTILAVPRAKAAEPAVITPTAALPGNGLAQHDFMYAGESKERRAFIVSKGKVVWSYDDPVGRGEISDAVLLSNGNLLLAHQYAVKLIAPDKKIVWVLRSWETPDLGHSTTIQILDESAPPENLTFGTFK